MQTQWNTLAREVLTDLKELAELTSDAKGAQRLAWTPVWDTAVQWFQNKCTACGASVKVDAARNIWATLPGTSEEAVIIGSHLDSVEDGGWLDGALGVVAGIGLLRHYARLAAQGTPLPKTLHVVSWADEEGARFGRSCVGSTAACGTLDADTLRDLGQRRDARGVSFAEALKAYDMLPEQIAEARGELAARKGRAYLELHIEQAPVLESRKQDVACVYGIAGCERQYLHFTGQCVHAGAPISLRRDAFLAAAEAALDFRRIAIAHNAYCTVGQVEVSPGVVTIVPEKCTITLDQRCMDETTLETMRTKALESSRRIAAENTVDVRCEHILSMSPTRFDQRLTALCAEAVAEESGAQEQIFSGPLHDAAALAKVIPSTMMFVMSSGGLSHCQQENSPEAALEAGVRAFARLTHKVLQG